MISPTEKLLSSLLLDNGVLKGKTNLFEGDGR